MSAAALPLDTIVFASASVTIGAFRCRPGHPRFPDTGPIERDIVVFPRRTVEICHEGGRPFVADAGIVTLYNRGQRYRRAAVSADGDASEWFAVEKALLGDVLRPFDPAVDDRPLRPFTRTHGPSSSRAYLRQRALFERLRRGDAIERLAVEEEVVAILAETMAGVMGPAPKAPVPSVRARAAVDGVRRLLSARLGEPLGLVELAQETGLSAFHLCRAFRAATGRTLHATRNRLRLHRALERVLDGEDLTTVALDLGYSSHSHFTVAFRELFGTTPSAVRATFR